jgi:hypothetical protein
MKYERNIYAYILVHKDLTISRKSVEELRGRRVEFKNVSNSGFGRSNIQPSKFASIDFVTSRSKHSLYHYHIHTHTNV